MSFDLDLDIADLYLYFDSDLYLDTDLHSDIDLNFDFEKYVNFQIIVCLINRGWRCKSLFETLILLRIIRLLISRAIEISLIVILITGSWVIVITAIITTLITMLVTLLLWCFLFV